MHHPSPITVSSLAQRINQHQYPVIVSRYPRLLWVQYLLNRLLYRRTWAIRRAVNSELRRRSGPVRFVDAGCGAGDFLIPFARRFPQARLTGIDHNPQQVDLINRYASKTKRTGLSAVVAGIASFELDQPADVILCASVLHYQPDDQAVLHHLYQKLKPGGTLLLYTPIRGKRVLPGYRYIRERWFAAVDYDRINRVRQTYTLDSLTNKLHVAGFQVAEYHWINGTIGRLAYELTSLTLFAMQCLPSLLAIVLGLIYTLLAYPWVFLFMLIDTGLTSKSGNGLLLSIKKD